MTGLLKRRADGHDSPAAGRAAPSTAKHCRHRRSVPAMLGGIASVARAEQQRYEFLNVADNFGESTPGNEVLPCSPMLPYQEAKMHGCNEDLPTVEESIAESSDSSTESSHPASAPEIEVLPHVLPPLKQLLPQEWQHDRGLLHAWQKARDMAARPGVVSFCNSFELTGAVHVISKSEGIPRSVNLVTCRCNCPNPRCCTHLLAAALVADSERLRGRIALLCHLREHLRRHGRGGNDVAVAEKVAQPVIQELVGSATQEQVPRGGVTEQVMEWAVDASIRLACAMQGRSLVAAVDGFAAEPGATSTTTRSQSSRSRSPWGRCHTHGMSTVHSRTRQALTLLASQAAAACSCDDVRIEEVVDETLKKIRLSSATQLASGLANAAVEAVVIMLRRLDAALT